MKKYMIAMLFALSLLLFLPSCDKSDTPPDDTTATKDWRNAIEYEGNFYVNSQTKLLYSLDRGTITLWDNSGDGSVLQELEYNSAEDGAIESLTVEDINLDGNNDMKTIYSETEAGKKYNLWLWDATNGKYVSCKGFRAVNDPVVSEDGKTVSGIEDKGIFGRIETVFSFTEDLALEQVSGIITNETEIASAVSDALLGGEPVEKTENLIEINEEKCTVYTVGTGDSKAGYIVCSPSAFWYIDRGCVGVYKNITDSAGTYKEGVYMGEAGETANICAELYGCDVGELTIDSIDMGTVVDLSYNEDGVVIMPDPEAEIVGSSANGYRFYRGGEFLCHILKTESGKFYCCDSQLSGDMYYHLISAAGETTLTEGSVAEFYIE